MHNQVDESVLDALNRTASHVLEVGSNNFKSLKPCVGTIYNKCSNGPSALQYSVFGGILTHNNRLCSSPRKGTNKLCGAVCAAAQTDTVSWLHPTARAIKRVLQVPRVRYCTCSSSTSWAYKKIWHEWWGGRRG